MMGLERLIQRTYGTTPQIDLEKKILRARVPRAEPLDFPALADGIKKANVTAASILVDVEFDVEGDAAVLRGTGQKFKIEGASRAGSRLRVLAWESPDTVRVELVP